MSQAKTLTLSLGEHWNDFINHKIDGKRFASASEVVRSALRLLEEAEANSKLEELRAALDAGEESGDAGPLDIEAIKQSARKMARIE